MQVSRSTESRGQASLEMVLITSVIMILVLAITGYWYSISDSTFAMVVLKTKAIEVLGDEGEHYLIERIDFIEAADGTSISMELIISPQKPAGFDNAACTSIADEVVARTKYTSADITVNDPAEIVCNSTPT